MIRIMGILILSSTIFCFNLDCQLYFCWTNFTENSDYIWKNLLKCIFNFSWFQFKM